MPWPTEEEQKLTLPGWMQAVLVVVGTVLLIYQSHHNSPEAHAARNCVVSYHNARNARDTVATDNAHMPIGGGPYIYDKTCAELRAAGRL